MIFVYYLKSDSVNQEVFLKTDATLRSISVTSPNGDEDWAIGSDQTITWTSAGIDTGNVSVQVSYNGGTDWIVLDGSATNDGTFNWTVQGPVTSGALFKIVSNAYGTFDESDATFNIVKTPATVNLSDLTYNYNGTPREVTATTTPAGLAVDITYGGSSTPPTDAGNYVVIATINDTTYQGTATETLEIAKATLMPSVTVAGKVYDNTTAAVIADKSLGGTIFGDDEVGLTGGVATFANEHAGSKTATINGLSLTGADAGNYQLAAGLVTATADISKLTINVSAQSETKTYDGTAACSLSPNVIGLADGDDSGFVQNFGSKHAYASNQAIIASGVAIDGNGGNNYEVVFQNNSGRINKLAITVTAVADSKLFDGGVSSASVPTVSPAVAAGDTAAFIQEFSNANAGEEKILTPSGIVEDGNFGNNYAYTFVNTSNGEILKAAASVTLDGLTWVYDGTPKPATASTVPEGLTVSLTYDGSATAPMAANSYNVVASIEDENYQGGATGTLVIAKATPTITWNPANLVYPTPLGAEQLNASANVEGSFSYTPASGAVLGAGMQEISARFTPANTDNYNVVDISRDIEVSKAIATVMFDGLAHFYDGTAKSATATTSPAGFTVDITYDGSATAPVNAGSYTIVGIVNDANYQGSATATMQIEKADAPINLTNLDHVYDGNGKQAAAITIPDGLPVVFTYDGESTLPVNAGSYTVTATIDHQNYQGSAIAYLYIDKAAATIQLGSLTPTYDGTPKQASATTTPEGLTVTFTYDSQPVPPTNVGSYEVMASISELNYQGVASGAMTIGKATVTSISVSGLTQTYDGTPREVTVEIVPSGVTYTVTYAGSPTPPTIVGSYPVVVTVTDANYQGGGDWTMTIAKADPDITWNTPVGIAFGDELDSTQLNATAEITGSFIYNPPAGTVLNAGAAQLLSVQFTPSDSFNYNIINRTVSLDVAKASANVTFTGLDYTYDGSAKQATVTTHPGTLSVDVTYNDLATAPTNAGSYNVRGVINDENYQGIGTATLTIEKATATLVTSGFNHTYDRTAKVITVETVPAGLPLTVTYNGSATAPTAADTYAVDITVNDINYRGSTTSNMVIAQAALTPTVTVANKVHDGTVNATILTRTLSGVFAGDTVSLAGGTAVFESASVGNDKTVTVTGLSLIGTAAGNYLLSTTTVTTTANITQEPSNTGGGSFGNQLVGIGLSGISPWMDNNGRVLTAGWVHTDDGKLSLTIPVGTSVWNAAGAAASFLSANGALTAPGQPTQGKLIVSYELGPSGATFNPTITLTMSYTLADIPAGATEKDLYIAWWDGAKWVKLGTTLDTATKTVSAQVSHFTTFGLIAQVPPITTTPPTTTAPPTTTVPPATTTSPPASTTPGTTTATTSPPTASDPAEKDDNGNPLLPVGIALIGAAMLLGIVIYRRKGHK